MELLELKQGAQETNERAATLSLRNILFATDLSAISEAALPYADAICRRFGSTLHIASVLSDANLLMMTGGVDYVSIGTLYEDAQRDAEEKVEAIARRLGKLPCRTYVRHGKIWTSLAEIVDRNRIDLIVVGTHGRTGMGKLLLGSVAENILRHSPCPVLTVGPKVRGRARLPELPAHGSEIAPAQLELQQIVYATNLTAESRAVARTAIALAGEFQARLTLLHVVEDDSRLNQQPGLIERGLRQLQQLIPEDANLAYIPEPVMEFGFASECIVDAAAERQADLIVIGAHPADGATHMQWSTVHRVVAHANCPVLTVRGRI